MRFDQHNNATVLTLDKEEAVRIKAMISAVGNMPTESLEMGVIEHSLRLADLVIKNRSNTPLPVVKEAVIVDLLLQLGMEETDAKATKRKTAKSKSRPEESCPSPVPGTSL